MISIYENLTQIKLDKILSRAVENSNLEKEQIVKNILDEVRQFKDMGISRLQQKIDLYSPKLKVSNEDIDNSELQICNELKDAIRIAKSNIEKFHTAQKTEEIRVETQQGVECWQKSVAISKVGLYIPAGSAPLFSTVLMLAIPAIIAGVEEIVLCSPAQKNSEIAPEILYTAKICGIKNIFRVGGAVAIAAMAYGTETIPKVDKIFGPGNSYVTIAKQLVAGKVVSIDIPAGPSELMIIADDSCRYDFVASDMLSQAEHGTDSQVFLVCLSKDIAQGVLSEIKRQLQELPRRDIATKALENSAIIVVDSYNQMIEIVNQYAPEHLIIACESCDELSMKVKSAGSVFLGNYSPESAGDYASGTNHTLPTSAWAKSMSGVNIDSFTKKITFQKISKQGIKNLAPIIEIMAEKEMLIAHRNSAKIRREYADR